MAGLYALRFVLTLISPVGATPEYWLGIARQTARDGAIIAFLLVFQRYCADYTTRRASFSLRRKDTVALCLLSLAYLSLAAPWPRGFLIATPFCAIIYFWELRNIHRDESLVTLKT
jgi:hypothetical protein